MFKRFFPLFAFFCLPIALAAAPVSGECLPTPSLPPSAASFTFDSDSSYLPLSQTQKEGIYWGLKSVSLTLSSIYLLSELLFPVASPEAQQAIDPLFKPWCHRLRSRSFIYPNGEKMPLCARCTGMNIGIFLGHFDSFIWDSFSVPGWERWQQGLLHIGIESLFTLPLLIDGTLQYSLHRYQSNNPLRLTTGILFGYACTAMADELLQLILDYSPARQKKQRPISPVRGAPTGDANGPNE